RLHAAGTDARRRSREPRRRSPSPGSPGRPRTIRPPAEHLRACLIQVSAWTGQHLQARPAHELSRRRRSMLPASPTARTPALDIPTRDLTTTPIGLASRKPCTIPLTLPSVQGENRGFLICRCEGVQPAPQCSAILVTLPSHAGFI